MKNEKDKDEIRKEYSLEQLGAGVRGKHYAAYEKSKNLVLLSPEVAAAFPSEEAVNEALRQVISDRSTSGS